MTSPAVQAGAQSPEPQPFYYPQDRKGIEATVEESTRRKAMLYDQTWEEAAKRLDDFYSLPERVRYLFYTGKVFNPGWDDFIAQMSHINSKQGQKLQTDFNRLKGRFRRKAGLNRSAPLDTDIEEVT